MDDIKPLRAFDDLGSPLDVVFCVLRNEGVMEGTYKGIIYRLTQETVVDNQCDYHQQWGHHTRQCRSLLHKIQDLIEEGIIEKPPPPGTFVIKEEAPEDPMKWEGILLPPKKRSADRGVRSQL